MNTHGDPCKLVIYRCRIIVHCDSLPVKHNLRALYSSSILTICSAQKPTSNQNNLQQPPHPTSNVPQIRRPSPITSNHPLRPQTTLCTQVPQYVGIVLRKASDIASPSSFCAEIVFGACIQPLRRKASPERWVPRPTVLDCELRLRVSMCFLSGRELPTVFLQSSVVESSTQPDLLQVSQPAVP